MSRQRPLGGYGLLAEETCLELTALIEDSVNGIATPEQSARLDHLLLKRDEARGFYARYMHTLCSLRTWAECPAGDSSPDSESAGTVGSDAISQPHFRDFLGRLPSALGKLKPVFWVSLVLVLGVALTFAIGGFRRHFGKSDDLALPSNSAAKHAVVARLVRSNNCVWEPEDAGPLEGGSLHAGQRLSLNSGLAEITFDCGARVILQGRASFKAESVNSAVLDSGKVTVRAETVAAKGFAIRTPGMKTVDLGTEFGLEVAPTGVEQVHVFRGEVVVSPSLADGLSVAPQHLTESQGLEFNADTQGVKFVANDGERFARSLEDADHKRHVVAYWRFEDHAVGVLVPDSKKGQAPVRGSLDSSLNGNDLYTYSEGTQPRFSPDVSEKIVPQSGAANTFSLDNSTPPIGAATRDLFTKSDWSRPSGTDLQTITPREWTIEATVKPARLPRFIQAFVVRDGASADENDPKIPPLAFQVTPEKHFEIVFCDVDRRMHKATAEGITLENNRWHHVAASSDGKSLKLYVDLLDGKGYVLASITPLPATGNTALGRGEHKGPLYPNIWSIGRGSRGGHPRQMFQGWIDEVRICDVALPPTEFLFAKRVGTKVAANSTDERREQIAGRRNPDIAGHR